MQIDGSQFEWWKFCGVKDNCETVGLQNPWRFRGYTWASDGRIIVRCWGDLIGAAPQLNDRLPLAACQMFEGAARRPCDAGYQPLVMPPLVCFATGLTDCAGCNGRGRIGPGLTWHEALGFCGLVCPECNGRGDRLDWVAPLGKQLFHCYYVRMLAALPGCEWRPTADDPRDDQPITFRWPQSAGIPGGDGLLMSLYWLANH